MTYKWETIKDKAIDFVAGKSIWDCCYKNQVALVSLAMEATIGKDYNWKKSTEELRQQAITIINNWDIRMAKKLVDLFPEIIPERLRDKPITCYMADNDNADWMIEFAEKT